MLSIIVAIANENVIGKDNQLIWHLPEDLKRFKEITTGHKIIMGRKTFESLGRVLPNRKHIILCNDMEMDIDNENVEVLDDISKLDKYIKSDEECFVIGGATIYKLLMPYANKMYITKINQSFVSIPLSRMINKIENKCEEHNINCIIINESYTSLSSFYDNDKIEKQETYSGKRIKRGLYLTKNKIEVNADVNASLNILRKSKPNDDEVIHYLRDRGLTIPKRLQVIL